MELPDRISIAKQSNLLLAEMDPRERCIPIVAGAPSGTASYRHASSHTNVVMVGIKPPMESPATDWSGLLSNLIRATIYIRKHERIEPPEVVTMLADVKILGSSVPEILNVAALSDSNEIRWAKALYQIPTTFELTRGDLTTCPHPGKAMYKIHKNEGGVEKPVSFFKLTESFRYRNTRGMFSYIGGSLVSLHTNYSNTREFLQMLMEIAVHIGFKFVRTKGSDLTTADSKIREMVRLKPHELIGCKKTEMKGIKSAEEGILLDVGSVKISDNTEYSGGERAICEQRTERCQQPGSDE